MPSLLSPTLSPPTSAEATQAGWLTAIEQAVDTVFTPIADLASAVVFFPLPLPGGAEIPFVVLWLIAGACLITVYFGFIQFRGLRVATEVVRGKYSQSTDPGEITHFQALSSALSGTVGLGNIAGVAVAVSLGGPGATVWMIVAGLLGMATKFLECTLGVKYREVHEDGTVSGGGFRYLPIAFARFGSLPAKILTGVFAVAILFFGLAGGNMFQSNQTYAIFRESFGGDQGWLASDGASLVFGLVMATAIAVVIIGGISSIGRVTSKLVPGMGIFYLLSCLAVIALHLDQVPAAFGAILAGAFSPEGVAGGVIGALVIGFQRAAFSNEAGLGSAPIAHSAVKTRRPVSEGFVALWEPFLDTVVICTMTALTVVIANPQGYQDVRAQAAAALNGQGEAPDPAGVGLTAEAFQSVFPGFQFFLMIAVLLFAFSTCLTWAYYGEKAWHFLFGRARGGVIFYRVLFCAFTVFGAILTLQSVLDFADSALFVCAFINVLGIVMLMPVVKKEMQAYLRDRRNGTLLELGGEDEDQPSTARS